MAERDDDARAQGCTLSALKRGLIAFQRRYQHSAKPFKWTFTRRDLHVLQAEVPQRHTAPEDTVPEYVTVIANRGTLGTTATGGLGSWIPSADQCVSPRRATAVCLT
jgi:hypothetical protein